MKRHLDLKTGKFIIEVSEYEQNLLNEIKERFKGNLDIYVENERIDLDLELSGFITNKSKRSQLYNLRHHVIHDLAYNDDFEKVVYFENGFVKFDNDKFLEFANAYNLIDDEGRGQRVLYNIIRVQIIDWLLQNEFNNDDERQTVFKLPKKITTSRPEKVVPEIFKTDDDLKLFEYCLEHAEFDKSKLKNMNGFYFWLKGRLNCTTRKFSEYLKTLNIEGYKVKLYDKGASNLKGENCPEIDEELNSLKESFNAIK